MGRQFIHYLNQPDTQRQSRARGAAHRSHSSESEEPETAQQQVFSCKYCGVDFCYQSDLISKNFHGKTGQAFLFNKCVNVFAGPQSEKEMMTGKHICVDIYCVKCCIIIGWSYVSQI